MRDVLNTTTSKKLSPVFMGDCSRELVKSEGYLSASLSLKSMEEGEDPAPLSILNASLYREVGKSGQLFSVDVEEKDGGVFRAWVFIRVVCVQEGRIRETSYDQSPGEKQDSKQLCSVNEIGLKKSQQKKGCDHKVDGDVGAWTSLSFDLKFQLKTRGVFYLYATTLNSLTYGALSSRFYLSMESKKEDKKEKEVSNGEGEEEEEEDKGEEDLEEEDGYAEEEEETSKDDENEETIKDILLPPSSFAAESRTTSAPYLPNKAAPPLLKRDGASLDLIALKQRSTLVEVSKSTKSEPQVSVQPRELVWKK